jgi:hypothetical protein
MRKKVFGVCISLFVIFSKCSEKKFLDWNVSLQIYCTCITIELAVFLCLYCKLFVTLQTTASDILHSLVSWTCLKNIRFEGLDLSLAVPQNRYLFSRSILSYTTLKYQCIWKVEFHVINQNSTTFGTCCTYPTDVLLWSCCWRRVNNEIRQ